MCRSELRIERKLAYASIADCLGLSFGTNQSGVWSGFLELNDAEAVNFHCVPNQVLSQAEPFPDTLEIEAIMASRRAASSKYSIRYLFSALIQNRLSPDCPSVIGYVPVVEATGRREVSYR